MDKRVACNVPLVITVSVQAPLLLQCVLRNPTALWEQPHQFYAQVVLILSRAQQASKVTSSAFLARLVTTVRMQSSIQVRNATQVISAGHELPFLTIVQCSAPQDFIAQMEQRFLRSVAMERSLKQEQRPLMNAWLVNLAITVQIRAL